MNSYSFAAQVTYSWKVIRALSALAMAALLTVSVSAQPLGEKDDKPKPKGPPNPDPFSLTTKDGVLLKCTWWEPEEPGKETVPIILLHGWEGKRQEYDRLARGLQLAGHAVVSVDLRGHGGSTTVRRPNRDTDDTIDPDRMRAIDFAAMARGDLVAVKRFLLDKNNEGLLNIKLLCVVAADMSTVVALNWIAFDWSLPDLIGKPQGKDVQAMVLLSPESAFKGLTTADAIRQLSFIHSRVKGLSTMIIVGRNDRKALRESQRIHDQFERFHTNLDDIPEDQRNAKMDLFFQAPNTTLQGTKLLSVPALQVEGMISEFIRLRLVNKKEDFPWQDRG